MFLDSGFRRNDDSLQAPGNWTQKSTNSSSLFCVGKQLLQVSLTQRIDSPKFLDRINRMDRMLPAGRKPDRQ